MLNFRNCSRRQTVLATLFSAINQLTLLGRVGRMPEIQGDQGQIAILQVATNETIVRRNEFGERKCRVDFCQREAYFSPANQK